MRATCLVIGLLPALWACDGTGDLSRGQGDRGPGRTDGASLPDATPSDATPGDAEPGEDATACAPTPCPADACGPRPDGCGRIQQCRQGCACEDDCPCEAAADCAPRPCADARCEAGACAYAPVTCGGAACTCAAEPCADDAPRPCGAGCEAAWCDPVPDGQGGFANRCLPVAALPCGACRISTSACDPATGAVTCDDLLPVEVAAGLECERLVLFVDPDYAGPERGSRQAPFRSLGAALDLAALAGVPYVVFGGSGEALGPVTLRDGVELRGGYTGHPEFLPSADRPRLRAVADARAVEDGQILALRAPGITAGAVRRLDITVEPAPPHPEGPTDDATPGVHTLGVLAIDSPGLLLEDIQITVGDASAGRPGADAGPVEVELPAALMDGAPGLDAPGTLGTGDCRELDDQIWDRYPNQGTQPCDGSPLGQVIPGARGAPGAVCPLDLDGVRSLSHPGGAGGQLALQCRAGAQGEAPAWPADQVDQRDGAPGRRGGFVDPLDRWRTLGNGAAGQPGIGGRPGQGGQSGASESCAFFPPGGGGGGAGGCGGFGGRPGGGGGAALGVAAVRSTGLSLVGVQITVGAGGAGAPGGAGSAGTPGGRGGPAGGGRGEFFNVGPPRPGEDGGPGHPGGRGGNGAGGDAAGVLCLETTLDPGPEALTVEATGAAGPGAEAAPAAPGPSGRAGATVGCGP